MERRVGYRGDIRIKKRKEPNKPLLGVLKAGTVEGREVQDILIDTGCSRTMVHEDNVPPEKILQGEATAIRCAHGDTVLYPLACVDISVGGKHLEVEAAVSNTLPTAVLLGTDVPELSELLSEKPKEEKCEEEECDVFVVTRAGAREQQRLEEERRQQEEDSGVQPNPAGLGDEEEMATDTQECTEEEPLTGMNSDLDVLDDSLFVEPREKTRLTRSQRRSILERHRRLVNTGTTLCTTMDDFKKYQEEDKTLDGVKQAVMEKLQGKRVQFFEQDGLLFQKWKDQNGEETEQLVVPERCRNEIMKIAHDTPFAGHLGREKTIQRILQRFYWPGIFRDVAYYCRSCPSCQKSSSKGVLRAPLVPLPIMATPFKRIAMDIVGPLPKSRSRKQYILVICDYATRFPEAIPMRSIDAAHIAEELLHLFARVGVPEEILTDQGSNFTSQLLTEIYQMLRVRPIRTTPYHPQTDGLVERFNGTLKSMLRKVVTKEGKDWDKLIPYLLFAYREVPQASTGFSPFELVYGRTVRGPLDVIRDTWTATKDADESVIAH
uniref:Integrase catalytic domain-containing protein n=1 Tax=Amphimedon queenslandica TaxID=400682 RepID=A0A1X7T3K8_AMPQE